MLELLSGSGSGVDEVTVAVLSTSGTASGPTVAVTLNGGAATGAAR